MSEPVRLDTILPQAMENIKMRCNRYRQKHGLPLLGEERKSRLQIAIEMNGEDLRVIKRKIQYSI